MRAVLETCSLCDVWTVASIQYARSGTKAGTTLAHNNVVDALFTVAQGDTKTGGRYSPAFTLDTPKKHVRAEIKRLNTRYPLQIERPIYTIQSQTDCSWMRNSHTCHPSIPQYGFALELAVGNIALSIASVRHPTTPAPRRQWVQLREVPHDPITEQRRDAYGEKSSNGKTMFRLAPMTPEYTASLDPACRRKL